MILRIGSKLDSSIKNYADFKKNSEDETKETPVSKPTEKMSLDALKANYAVNFGAKKYDYDSDDRVEDIRNSSTHKSQQILGEASDLAKSLGHKKVGYLHLMQVLYTDVIKYMDDLDKGERIYGDGYLFDSIPVLEDRFSEEMFRKPKIRKQIKPMFEEELKRVNKELKNTPSEKGLSSSKKVPLSQELLADISSRFSTNTEEEGIMTLRDGVFMQTVLWPEDDEINRRISRPFRIKLSKLLMIDNEPPEKKPHIKFYDDTAKHIWKNLDARTNMFALYENGVDPKYLVNSLVQTKNGERDNANITVFNKFISSELLFSMLNDAKADKDKTHVFVFNIDELMTNDMIDDPDSMVSMDRNLVEFYKKTPENIRFVIVRDKDKYYSDNTTPDEHNPFRNFGEISIPIINADVAKKVLKEEPLLLKDVKKPFTPNAIDKLVDATIQLTGHYPAKAVRIMELMSSFYIGKKEITPKEVADYQKQAKHIFKPKGSDDSAVNLVYNTGIKVKDIIGSSSTQQEADIIAKMIKTRTMGTKGYIIYSEDGSVGAGRKYTAQAIAGEAKVPYFEIDARKFGTKDVDLFGMGSNMTPEKSITKLFSLIKQEADTRPNKGAILFIQQFENFSCGEEISEYDQQAMAQIILEMKNAQKDGYNIVVIGSVNDPNAMDEATYKSIEFNDFIEIESPSSNIKARLEILDYYSKKRKLNIKGDTPEQKMQTLKIAAETTDGFSYNDILKFLEKSKSISKIRKHKAIDTTDFVEAFLQITSGRVSSRPLYPHDKEMVTAHECGHALTQQLMYDLLEQNKKPWHLPYKVNFIALDPRSSYLGAVYAKESENNEFNFEKVFSELITLYGGHSVEKILFDQDGSWGITADMNYADNYALTAVTQMGLGPRSGKISLTQETLGSIGLSNQMRRDIELDKKQYLEQANKASDLICTTYRDFIQEFTNKYKDRVGTGDCLIMADEFQKGLRDWKSRQSAEKLAEIKTMEETIRTIMEETKTKKSD